MVFNGAILHEHLKVKYTCFIVEESVMVFNKLKSLGRVSADADEELVGWLKPSSERVKINKDGGNSVERQSSRSVLCRERSQRQVVGG